MKCRIITLILFISTSCAIQQPLQTTVDGVTIIYLTPPPAPLKSTALSNTYKVKKGDTIFSIARDLGVDYHKLAQINNIGENYIIIPGQILQIANASEASPTAPPPPTEEIESSISINIIWPLDSLETLRYRETKDKPGLNIISSKNVYIVAAADGEVVYAGEELEEYGRMILISHKEKFLTVYAYTAEILVQEGQQLKRGERIAQPRTTETESHWYFEVRQDGKSVDPLSLLPKIQNF